MLSHANGKLSNRPSNNFTTSRQQGHRYGGTGCTKWTHRTPQGPHWLTQFYAESGSSNHCIRADLSEDDIATDKLPFYVVWG